jgi:hypothetical protein
VPPGDLDARRPATTPFMRLYDVLMSTAAGHAGLGRVAAATGAADPATTGGNADVPDNAGAPADQVFSTVRHRVLAMHPDDEQGRMLRSPGLKTAGTFYAFASATDLVVKLPSSRVAELVDSGRGLPCSPRPGRPMKQWVRIPAPDEPSCLSYLLEARAFVSAGAGNRTD